MFTTTLSAGEPPVVAQTTQYTLTTFTNTYDDQAFFELQLPEHYTVTGGAPPVYDEYVDDGIRRVVWQSVPQLGVVETFALWATPGEASGYFELVYGLVLPDPLADSILGIDALWARVGDALTEPAVTANEPPLADTEPPSPLEFAMLNVPGGGPVPFDLDPLSPEELPIQEPLEVFLDFLGVPEPGVPVTSELTVRSTVDFDVEYAAVVDFPSHWALVSGTESFTDIVTCGNERVYEFVVEPAFQEGTWESVAVLELPRDLLAVGYENYRVVHYGVMESGRSATRRISTAYHRTDSPGQ